MRQFINYCEYKEYGDNKKLALMVLLAGGAATWLESLTADQTDTWQHLHDVFKTRYTAPSFMKFKSAKDLFNTKQQPSQSVDDFVAYMQKFAKFVEADEKMVMFAVLNGLRPEISTYVTQQQPKDIRELLDQARVGEMTNTKQPEKETATEVQIALVQNLLRELTTQMNKAIASSVRQDDRESLRTPSPRRVRFEEETPRYSRGNEGRRSWRFRRYETAQRYQPRSFSPGRCGEDEIRRGRGNGRFD